MRALNPAAGHRPESVSELGTGWGTCVEVLPDRRGVVHTVRPVAVGPQRSFAWEAAGAEPGLCVCVSHRTAAWSTRSPSTARCPGQRAKPRCTPLWHNRWWTVRVCRPCARALLNVGTRDTGVLNGFNGAVLAYGQTGSGKTFTMQVTPPRCGRTCA